MGFNSGFKGLNSINKLVSVKETSGVLCELELKFYT